MIKTSHTALSKQDKVLIDSAEAAMMYGYAPYTKFYVGAAVRTKSGKIYLGSNVETASYIAVCAERSAISAAVSDGEYELIATAVISKSDFLDVKQVAGPCGICRQLIFEQCLSVGLEFVASIKYRLRAFVDRWEFFFVVLLKPEPRRVFEKEHVVRLGELHYCSTNSSSLNQAKNLSNISLFRSVIFNSLNSLSLIKL